MLGLTPRTAIQQPSPGGSGGGSASNVSVNANTNLVSVGLITLVKATGGAGGITLTLPDAALNPNKIFSLIRVDAAVGAITIQGTGGQTINGNANWLLTNQWQFVEVQSDGTNWIAAPYN